MDTTSLPVGDGANIELNVLGMDRAGNAPLSWVDATNLLVTTGGAGPFSPPVDADTTRCTDTTGIRSSSGTPAATWNAVPVNIV